ncbi:MAG: phosphotransferase [Actinobacteria bacterium]|nr:phosphotransferase [Actinomycetota bacterium]
MADYSQVCRDVAALAGPIPPAHSVLSSAALAATVLPLYNLRPPTDCRLLAHNLNDTYLVRTAAGPFVLRVYQAHRATGRSWRSLPEILYEVDLLRHLRAKGMRVSAPVPRRDGAYTTSLSAPEGERPAVLFTYAPGAAVTPVNQDEARARRYGQALADIHTASDDFTSPHPRFALDLAFLVEGPLRTTAPLLGQRAVDAAYLRDLAALLEERIQTWAYLGLDVGPCHGDAHGGNAHLGDDGRLTFFDFDVCGPGWRAYDLAVFRWGVELGRVRVGRTDDEVRRLWDAFMQGYSSRRIVGDADLHAVPSLVAARHLWFLGVTAGNWDNWSCNEVDDTFIDRELAFLREWVTQQIVSQG